MSVLHHRGRRRAPFFFLCAVCLLFSGCASEVAETDFASVTVDMTQAEVEAILGVGKEVAWEDIESTVAGLGAGISSTSCDKWVKWGNRKQWGIVGFKDGEVREQMFRKKK